MARVRPLPARVVPAWSTGLAVPSTMAPPLRPHPRPHRVVAAEPPADLQMSLPRHMLANRVTIIHLPSLSSSSSASSSFSAFSHFTPSSILPSTLSFFFLVLILLFFFLHFFLLQSTFEHYFDHCCCLCLLFGLFSFLCLCVSQAGVSTSAVSS